MEHYTPGREVQFRFDPAIGLIGIHRFQIEPAEQGARIRHTVLATPTGWMWLAWPIGVRWLHEALVHDAFDQLTDETPQRWSAWVRMLRRIVRRLP